VVLAHSSLHHGSYTTLSSLGSSSLLAVSKTQRVCWKERTLNNLRNKFWDISFQNFKNCFEQWLKRWEHCKEQVGVYFEKF
jgi:hypothetical protein